MSPLPTVNEIQGNKAQLHSKRINLNPVHYAVLPLKNNWEKVAPVLDKYKNYTRIVSILLGGIGLIAMLDSHKWKLPRWPWAKDGRNNPPPSYKHENEQYTVDQLAEKKLMEALKEMKMNEGVDDIPLGKGVPKESDDEAVKEAEQQFIEDAQCGVRDVVEKMEKEGALPPEAQ